MDLHDACENGNIYLIKQNLEEKDRKKGGWKITDRDETGRTALHAACFSAQVDVVKLLFGMTVNMDVGDYEGDDNDHNKAQELAIEFVNNSSNNVTLGNRKDLCLGQDKTDPTYIDHDLKHEIIVNDEMLKNYDKAYQDIYGNTPLLTICYIGSKGEHDTEIVDLLLKHGDLVNKWGGTDKMTPLCWSSYHGDIEIVERLLKEKANPVWHNTPGCQFAIDLCGTRAMLRAIEGLTDDLDAEEAAKLSNELHRRNKSSMKKKPKTNFGNPKECCRILLKWGIAHLGKEKQNEMFIPSNKHPELNEQFIHRYWQHLLYWSAFLNEIDDCKQLLNVISQKMEKEEENRIKQLELIKTFYPAREALLLEEREKNKMMNPQEVQNDKDKVETRVNITNTNNNDGTNGFYNVGGGLILKSTIKNDSHSDGAIIHRIEPDSFFSKMENRANDIRIGYHLTMIDDNNDDETALLMPFHEIVHQLESMKNVLTAKNNSEMLNVKGKIPGFNLYFCKPEQVKDLLQEQENRLNDNNTEYESGAWINPLKACYPWIKNSYAETPLHVACRYGNPEIVKAMIEFLSIQDRREMANGKDWKNYNGDTPIHLAVLQNNPLCAKYIVETGVELGLINSMGWKEWDLCEAKFGSKTIVNVPMRNIVNNKKQKGNKKKHVANAGNPVKIIREESQQEMSLRTFFLRKMKSQHTSSNCDFVLVFGTEHYEQCKHLYEAFKNVSEETLDIVLGCNRIANPKKNK